MPQVWLTYEELGNHFECEAAQAREAIIENGWPRRKCSDRLTRVKLPPALAHEYMIGFAARFAVPATAVENTTIEMSTDQMVHELRDILAQAYGPLPQPITRAS